MRKAARQRFQVCSHPWIDEVDLAMHRAIARKIRHQPQLYQRARRNLARWEKVKRACPAPLREWKEILATYNMDAVLRILTRRGEAGNRLRSTAPFCGILTSREIEAIWAQYDQKRV